MNEYTPNSHKYKEAQKESPVEKKKVEKIVTGKVKTQENGLRKFTDIFISEDVKNVKSFVFMDVLVPAIKKAISDIVTDGIDMILYGGSGGGRHRNSTPGSKISYQNYYDRDRSDRHSSNYRNTRYSYDDIVLDNRMEAEGVVNQLHDLIDTYGVAAVADLYDLVGVTPETPDYKYGWMNVKNAEIVRVRDGWKIKLPKALPLD